MRILKILVLLAAFITSPFAYAEEVPQNNEEPNYLTFFLMAEGLIAVNAYLASEEPHAYGVVAGLLFPLAALESKSSDTTRWIMLGLAESLAIYNISIDEDEKSKSDIFRENIIGWHLFAGLSLATAYFVGDLDEDKTMSLSYVPRHDGGRIQFNYRF